MGGGTEKGGGERAGRVKRRRKARHGCIRREVAKSGALRSLLGPQQTRSCPSFITHAFRQPVASTPKDLLIPSPPTLHRHALRPPLHLPLWPTSRLHVHLKPPNPHTWARQTCRRMHARTHLPMSTTAASASCAAEKTSAGGRRVRLTSASVSTPLARVDANSTATRTLWCRGGGGQARAGEGGGQWRWRRCRLRAE